MTKLHSIAFAFVFGSTIAYAPDPPSRHITLTYTFYLTNNPENAKQVDCPQLNLFAEPYAEADGTAIQNVKWAASFQENN